MLDLDLRKLEKSDLDKLRPIELKGLIAMAKEALESKTKTESKTETNDIQYQEYRGYQIVLQNESGLAVHVLTDYVISYLTMTLPEWNIDLFKTIIDTYLDKQQKERNR